MDVPPEVLQAGVNLTESMARNTAAMIMNKIRAAKESGRTEESIAALEEIINELQADKQELVSIAQSYKAELISQQLNSGDVRYIVETLFPLIRQLVEASSGGDEEKLEQLEAMKPFLSVETVNVLQLLGFNFRKAIGEPLTALCEGLILKQVNNNSAEQLHLEQLRNQQALVSLSLNEAAYERFLALTGRG
jgi:hypothetical protein